MIDLTVSAAMLNHISYIFLNCHWWQHKKRDSLCKASVIEQADFQTTFNIHSDLIVKMSSVAGEHLVGWIWSMGSGQAQPEKKNKNMQSLQSTDKDGDLGMLTPGSADWS